ncbi:MAG: hypothetical protein SF182_30200 [Deltaproteobacteria bacterium]|nr:hypothetical protein [Deltaproteobacteria bacterium]
MIGFVVGIGAMYWYIHNSEQVVTNADEWMQRSASQYRGDRDHQLVDQATGKR